MLENRPKQFPAEHFDITFFLMIMMLNKMAQDGRFFCIIFGFGQSYSDLPVRSFFKRVIQYFLGKNNYKINQNQNQKYLRVNTYSENQKALEQKDDIMRILKCF